MACNQGSVAFTEAILTSGIISGLYVGSLYLKWNRGDRDDPHIVRSRLLTLTLVTVVFELYVRNRISIPNVPLPLNPFLGASAGIFLTSLLYFGHLVALTKLDVREYIEAWTRRPTWLPVRDYVLAPILEELVFRRHSILLWNCLPISARIFGPAALFSLAHVHHAKKGELINTVFQLAYTFVFGSYAAALYCLSNYSIYPPISAHIFCNMLGLPDFHNILTHKRKNIILYSYAAALIFAALGAHPLFRILVDVQ